MRFYLRRLSFQLLAVPAKLRSLFQSAKVRRSIAGEVNMHRNPRTFSSCFGTLSTKEIASVFASLVRYPLRVYENNKAYTISTRAEMIRKYPSIFTKSSRQAILAQSPDCLFANGQGVMVADGRIWFRKDPDGKMRIVTLNIVSDDPK